MKTLLISIGVGMISLAIGFVSSIIIKALFRGVFKKDSIGEIIIEVVVFFCVIVFPILTVIYYWYKLKMEEQTIDEIIAEHEEKKKSLNNTKWKQR